MDIHASPAPLPELDAYLSGFTLRFRRFEGEQALDRYLTGLLTDLANKNCDTMAQAVAGTSEQCLQELLTRMQWEEEDLNRQRVERLCKEATCDDGVLILDDTGFAKQGTCSVGVSRQYSGTLGKVGNCQVAVDCCYSDAQSTFPVAVRLYLPEAWTSDRDRLERAGVPEDIGFMTKPEIALVLLDQARAMDVPHRCVVSDADYGKSPAFLDGLEDRKEAYVAGVPCDFPVVVCQGPTPVKVRADRLLFQQPRRLWRTIRWRMGKKGWLRKKFLALRCFRLSEDGRLVEGFLLGERAARGQAEERKYYWSNLAAHTRLETLAGYAHRRHAIEQFHEEAKGELGWDQYQGRLWIGFHRHAVLVMLAYSFLVWQELAQRKSKRVRGRPRQAFSPSTGSKA